MKCATKDRRMQVLTRFQSVLASESAVLMVRRGGAHRWRRQGCATSRCLPSCHQRAEACERSHAQSIEVVDISWWGASHL